MPTPALTAAQINVPATSYRAKVVAAMPTIPASGGATVHAFSVMRRVDTPYVVAYVTLDEGPTMKRFRPRAQGRASRINKRTSHITVVVSQPEIAAARSRKGTR